MKHSVTMRKAVILITSSWFMDVLLALENQLGAAQIEREIGSEIYSSAVWFLSVDPSFVPHSRLTMLSLGLALFIMFKK